MWEEHLVHFLRMLLFILVFIWQMKFLWIVWFLILNVDIAYIINTRLYLKLRNILEYLVTRCVVLWCTISPLEGFEFNAGINLFIIHILYALFGLHFGYDRSSVHN